MAARAFMWLLLALSVAELLLMATSASAGYVLAVSGPMVFLVVAYYLVGRPR